MPDGFSGNPSTMAKGLDERMLVLSAALQLEGMTSIFLARLLDIQDQSQSKTLGNKSSALSFNNKIDLLIDIGALEATTKGKFQLFMEIRNQFMHNVHATNFSKCLSFLDKGDNRLLKFYKQDENLNEEEKYKLAITALSEDLLRTTADITQKVAKKNMDKALSLIRVKAYKAITDSLKFMKSEVDQQISRLTENRSSIDASELNGFGTKIYDIVQQHWEMLMNEGADEAIPKL